MNTVDTIEYKGYTINIHHDEIPCDPIHDQDMLGTMVCCHKRYDLGHKQYGSASESIYNAVIDCYPELQRIHLDYDDLSEDEFCDKYWQTLNRHAIVLNLYLYDHSGLTISTQPFTCPWDSGQIGFIYVCKDKVRSEYNWRILTAKRNGKIEQYLRNEVKLYDDYLTGNVYGYTIDDPHTGEQFDSCWGFYGSEWESNGLTEYAYNAIDCEITSIENERAMAMAEEIGEIQF